MYGAYNKLTGDPWYDRGAVNLTVSMGRPVFDSSRRIL